MTDKTWEKINTVALIILLLLLVRGCIGDMDKPTLDERVEALEVGQANHAGLLMARERILTNMLPNIEGKR